MFTGVKVISMNYIMSTSTDQRLSIMKIDHQDHKASVHFIFSSYSFSSICLCNFHDLLDTRLGH